MMEHVKLLSAECATKTRKNDNSLLFPPTRPSWPGLGLPSPVEGLASAVWLRPSNEIEINDKEIETSLGAILGGGTWTRVALPNAKYNPISAGGGHPHLGFSDDRRASRVLEFHQALHVKKGKAHEARKLHASETMSDRTSWCLLK